MSHGYGRSVAVFLFGQNTQRRLCTISYNPVPIGWPACLPLPYRPLCCSGLKSARQETRGAVLRCDREVLCERLMRYTWGFGQVSPLNPARNSAVCSTEATA
jgi:hypothetical protein